MLLDEYNVDFAFISEHKLLSKHTDFLSTLHTNYKAIAVCDASDVSSMRYGKAGVGIMYKKDCSFSVHEIGNIPSDRICGVQMV